MSYLIDNSPFNEAAAEIAADDDEVPLGGHAFALLQ